MLLVREQDFVGETPRGTGITTLITESNSCSITRDTKLDTDKHVLCVSIQRRYIFRCPLIDEKEINCSILIH